MWKKDPMSGLDICLVFTLAPRESTLQYKRCVHFWNNFPCITSLGLAIFCFFPYSSSEGDLFLVLLAAGFIFFSSCIISVLYLFPSVFDLVLHYLDLHDRLSVSLCITSWSASLRSSFNQSSSIILPLYSCLQPNSDGSPHFLLLWRILLVPLIWGE